MLPAAPAALSKSGSAKDEAASPKLLHVLSSVCRNFCFVFATENLLQSSVDDSWTDSNLNRVSVIQFQEETKAEDEDDEAAAERRVSFVVLFINIDSGLSSSSWF